MRDVFHPILDLIEESPAGAIAVIASAIALVVAPICITLMAMQGWFQARRGRKLQRPAFGMLLCAILLVMGIPAILLGLLVKSRYFDRDRYEFDPNRTISVLDEGRQFETLRLQDSLYKADEGIRLEREHLERDRKALADGLKSLDQALLQATRESGPAAPALWPRFQKILASVAPAREWAGVDAPQQLLDATAQPAEVRGIATAGNTGGSIAEGTATPPEIATSTPVVEAPAVGGNTLSPEIEGALAKVPEAQQVLARMLPLGGLPQGWALRARGDDPPFETFNDENLYEKMDGRADSFRQFGVRGMACASYHPAGDDGREVQIYIFEMGDPFKALGKYGSEKPGESEPVKLGSEGYVSGGSVFFHADRYYTIVEVGEDDPKLAEFALTAAKRVVAKMSPADAKAGGTDSGSASTEVRVATSPDALFSLLPQGPGKASPLYAAKDVFGYSFLADVFLADYEEGSAKWQGFVRPAPTPEEAERLFDAYLEAVKRDGGEVKIVENTGAKRLAVCTNIGLVDVVFVKGNAFAGANGAPAEAPALKFATAFASSLPERVPTLPSSPAAGGAAGESNGDGEDGGAGEP